MNNIFHATSETYLSIAAANSFKVTHFSKHLREWKFEDVSKLVEFYMTHYKLKGQFGPEHFNVEAMEDHYGRDYVGFTIPYITVVARKDWRQELSDSLLDYLSMQIMVQNFSNWLPNLTFSRGVGARGAGGSSPPRLGGQSPPPPPPPICDIQYYPLTQWNLQIKDNLGPAISPGH